MAFGKLRDVLGLATELGASSAGLTMAQMMERTERSRSTVERMLAGLYELGIEAEPSQAPGEHHLLKRWRLAQPLPAPLVALGEQDRLAVEGLLLTLPDGAARGALAKLLASQRGVATGVAVDAHTLIERTAYTAHSGARYVGSETLIGALERAIQGLDELRLTYQADEQASPSVRLVKPLGLVFSRFGYLVALTGQKGIRSYRLNCILGVEKTGKMFTSPAWFDFKAWSRESFGIYHGDELKTWRIVFSPRLAARAASVHFHSSERKTRLQDGSLEVILRCRGERELMHEMQHPDWSQNVRIESPDAMKQEYQQFVDKLGV